LRAILIKYQQLFLRLLLLLVFVPPISVYSHGFHPNTLIHCDDDQYMRSLNQVVTKIKKRKKYYVASYDQKGFKWIPKQVQAAGFSRIPFYCTLSFDGFPDADIIYSPIQHFYCIADKQWIPVSQLNIGNQLLCAHNKSVQISKIEVIQNPLTVYTIQVKDTHIFLVGKYGIVAHNTIVPVAVAAVGLSLPSVSWFGASFGAMFGPLGLLGGVIAGGIIGFTIYTCMKDTFVEYHVALQPTDAESLRQRNNNNQESSSNTQGPYFDPEDNNNDKNNDQKKDLFLKKDLSSEDLNDINWNNYDERISKFENFKEILEETKDIEGAVGKDGPWSRILKNGIKSSEIHSHRPIGHRIMGSLYELKKAWEFLKKGIKVIRFSKRVPLKEIALKESVEFDIELENNTLI
jgi:hypothetical protein